MTPCQGRKKMKMPEMLEIVHEGKKAKRRGWSLQLASTVHMYPPNNSKYISRSMQRCGVTKGQVIFIPTAGETLSRQN
jgi:hypothetical protein